MTIIVILSAVDDILKKRYRTISHGISLPRSIFGISLSYMMFIYQQHTQNVQWNIAYYYGTSLISTVYRFSDKLSMICNGTSLISWDIAFVRMGHGLLFYGISFDTKDLSDIQWDIVNFMGHRIYSNGIWLAIYMGYGLLVHGMSLHDWISLDTKDLFDIQWDIVNFTGHCIQWYGTWFAVL